MLSVHTLSEIGRYSLAALYATGGVFNLTYGRTHPREFFGAFDASTWFGPYRPLIRDLILPNGAAFAALLGAFEIVVAGLLLAGGTMMGIGLVAGVVFTLLVVPASNVAGALANLALATGQCVLLWVQLNP